jgi:unsaturated chondroitin disaccharide hydrolase
VKIFAAAFLALALSLSGSAWAQPIPQTQDSRLGFLSFDLPAEQTGAFEVSFDATPLAEKIDAFTGISAAAPQVANDVAAMVRFNDAGTIDVRNGGSFRADQVLGYSANKTYRMRMVIDLAHRTYSVFVAPAGQPEVLLAKNYAFRSQQGAVKTLGKLVLAGFKNANGFFMGSHRVAGVSLKPVSAP